VPDRSSSRAPSAFRSRPATSWRPPKGAAPSWEGCPLRASVRRTKARTKETTGGVRAVAERPRPLRGPAGPRRSSPRRCASRSSTPRPARRRARSQRRRTADVRSGAGARPGGAATARGLPRSPRDDRVAARMSSRRIRRSDAPPGSAPPIAARPPGEHPSARRNGVGAGEAHHSNRPGPATVRLVPLAGPWSRRRSDRAGSTGGFGPPGAGRVACSVRSVRPGVPRAGRDAATARRPAANGRQLSRLDLAGPSRSAPEPSRTAPLRRRVAERAISRRVVPARGCSRTAKPRGRRAKPRSAPPPRARARPASHPPSPCVS
jgi:hypothetical protein